MSFYANYDIDPRQIEAQFFQDMTRYNITPRRNFDPVMDGKTHRFATAQDKGSEKSGAYFIHSDGWANWGVMDYRQHDKMQTGKFSTRDLTTEERAQLHTAMTDPAELRRREAEKVKEAERQRRAEQEALTHAWSEYRDTRNGLLSTHPYCQLKHISESRMLDYRAFIKERRLDGDRGQVGDMMIPYYAAESIKKLYATDTWKFQTLQFIRRTNGETVKRFYAGLPAKGACLPLIPFPIRDDGRRIMPERFIICEGAATGASLFKAFKYEEAVIIAGSCNNYMTVAETFRKLVPNAEIIIAADHDSSEKTGKNRGLEEASAVVKAGYADKKIMPPEKGMDYNDYYIKIGVI